MVAKVICKPLKRVEGNALHPGHEPASIFLRR